jgi:hypothetical protein
MLTYTGGHREVIRHETGCVRPLTGWYFLQPGYACYAAAIASAARNAIVALISPPT